MSKLHEILAVEETVVSAANKLLAELATKFNKYNDFFVGHLRTLKRIGGSPEDLAIEEGARKEKALPTNVSAEIEYIFPFVQKALDVKLRKHLTNQIANADITLEDGSVVMSKVPVDLLLDLEKLLPEWRKMFETMPTLDPSKEWVENSKGTYKMKEAVTSSQTEKTIVPVVLAPATKEHPAQVKEGSENKTVGTYSDLFFSGAASTQQKADVLTLCDKLLIAVKQARMRANSVEVVTPASGTESIIKMFTDILVAK